MPEHLCLERRPFAGAGQQDVRCLIKSLPGQTVALLADVPGPICFPRPIAPWREAEMGTNGTGPVKPRRIIDSRAEGQGCYRSDARHRHEAPACLVVAGRGHDQTMQALQFRQEDVAHLQQRLDHHRQAPPTANQLADTGWKAALARLSHFQAEAPGQAADAPGSGPGQAIVDVAQLADQQLFVPSAVPASPARAATLRARIGTMDRQEPIHPLPTRTTVSRPSRAVRTICAMARASVRSVLIGMARVSARNCRVSSSTTGRPAAPGRHAATATSARPPDPPGRTPGQCRSTQLPVPLDHSPL
jgi:hypothetical protein